MADNVLFEADGYANAGKLVLLKEIESFGVDLTIDA